jgi:DNA repair exonuclease SbcCD nuclease subunit
MARILHTADWQLGLRLQFVPGDRGARLRNERFDAVRRLADLAHAHAVDAVVVAGDVFDDNAVGAWTLQAARDALAQFAPVPVLLLPGNHDAATPEGALARLDAGPHVRVLLAREVVGVGRLAFHACPLFHRHEREDPTAWLPARSDDAIRVAVAHGAILDFGESTETRNRIDAAAVLAKGFDYLALGDWHGTLAFGPRVAYAGTPEPTRFTERDPGNALLVEIDGPGAAPRLTVLPVARHRWISRAHTLDGPADVEALHDGLAALPERAATLVELTLDGALSLAARARLDEVLAAHAEALLYLRWHDERLLAEPSADDLATLSADGFVGAAADALRTGGAAEDADALRLLYRLLREVPA